MTESAPNENLPVPTEARLKHGYLDLFHTAKPGRIACLMIFFSATVVFIPIFVRGFPVGTDAGFHFRWVNQFDEAWREPGVFYPRWLASANNGQGSPVMLYYPPLTIFTAAILKLLVGDTLRALAVSCWVGLVASGLTIYLFSRSVLSSWASLFATLLYILAPYHLFDLYQASALAEFWSFAWLPLVLYAVYRVAHGGGRRAVALLGISYALLLLTHLPASFALTLVLPVYVLLLTCRTRRLIQIAAGLVLGLGLSAIFLLPVMFERDYVRMSRLLRFGYENFFLFQHLGPAYKTRLFRPDLSSSSYSSALKPDNYLYLLKTDQAALGLLILFVVVTVIILIRNPRFRSQLGSGMVRPVWLVAALGLLMTSKLSVAVWRAVPELPYMQFPSRFLVIATAGTCVLGAAAASSLVFKSRLRIVSALVLAGAVVFNLMLSSFVIARAPVDEGSLDASFPRHEVPEYRPTWWDGKVGEEGELPPLTTSNGAASVKVIDDRGIAQSYLVAAATESKLKFRTLYFPGWTARVDGKLAAIGPAEEGGIQLQLDQGQHSVTLNFEDTWPRTAGKLVSALSLLVLLAMLWGSRKGMTRSAVQAH